MHLDPLGGHTMLTMGIPYLVKENLWNPVCHDIASNQLSPRARNIISACKEGESLEDFDHVFLCLVRQY